MPDRDEAHGRASEADGTRGRRWQEGRADPVRRPSRWRKDREAGSKVARNERFQDCPSSRHEIKGPEHRPGPGGGVPRLTTRRIDRAEVIRNASSHKASCLLDVRSTLPAFPLS